VALGFLPLPLAAGAADTLPPGKAAVSDPESSWYARGSIDSLSVVGLSLALVAVAATPFVSPSWSNPPDQISPVSNRGFVASVLPLLYGQDVFFGAPGQPPANMDWPVPYGPRLVFARGLSEPLKLPLLPIFPAGATKTGYRPAPLSETPPDSLMSAASAFWVRRIVDTVNRSLQGKLNNTLNVTLTENASSTVIVDPRISAFSALVFTPLTANAAVEQAAGGLYVSAQKSGEATVEHANNAQYDRRFRLAIFG
jgi:hypothetical protein